MKRTADILRCAARDQQVEDHIIFKACNYAKAVRMVLAARKTRIPITSGCCCLKYMGTISAGAGPAAISATTAFWLCTTTGALVVLLHLLLISCSSFTSANRCFSTAPPSDSSFIGLGKHNRLINLKELYGAAFITTHGRNVAAATTTVEDPDHIAIYLSKSRRKSPEVIDHVRQQAAVACNHHHNNNNYNILLLQQRLEITKTANLLQLLMIKLTWWTKDMMQIQLHMVRDLHKIILNLYDPTTAAVAADHNIAAPAHIQRRPRRMMSSSSRVHTRTRRRKLMLPESSNSYESPKHAAAAANFPHSPSSNDFFGDYRDPQSHPPRSN
ncbi:unnamed protein product [Sphagnum jensenii]|uniref:Uncharacterized protein n=1 Tax=Sphagnum jensenii TaxID=128206 RepID=A0ABP1BMT6_9BRYO